MVRAGASPSTPVTSPGQVASPVPGASPGPVASPVPPAPLAGAITESGENLTKLQQALLEAEIGGGISLKKGTLQELTTALKSKWSTAPKVAKSVDAFIKKHGDKNIAIPRPKEERISLLFDVARELR